MQTVLLAAAGSTRYEYVSPLVVLDEIVELTKQASLYEFLRQDVQPGGYHDHKKLVDVARGRLFDRIDDEVRVAVGLVEESEYARVFERYITHVMHAIKKEKVRNPATGRMEDPDEAMMREVERTLEISGRADDFRQSLIAKIGAWSLDHRGQKPVMSEIFSDLLRKLQRRLLREAQEDDREGHHRSRRAAVRQRGPPVRRGAHPRGHRRSHTLIDRYGYTRESARDLVGALASLRYRICRRGARGAYPRGWRCSGRWSRRVCSRWRRRPRRGRDPEDAQGAVPPGPRADVDHRDVADGRAAAREAVRDRAGRRQRTIDVARRSDRRGADRRAPAVEPVSLPASSVGDQSWEGEFATAPPTGKDVPFSFVVFGDSRNGVEQHRRVIERMSQEVPDFVLGTGDMVDEGFREEQWQQFFDVENRLLRDNVYFPALGNHDRQGRGRTADTYRAYFSVPENGGDTERYYAFTYASARFLVLDSNAYSFALTDQTAWLERELIAARQDPAIRHIFVVMHHPPFSISLHGGAHRSARAMDAAVREVPGVGGVLRPRSRLRARRAQRHPLLRLGRWRRAAVSAAAAARIPVDVEAVKKFERALHYLRVTRDRQSHRGHRRSAPTAR